jgi:hypothetical protein
MTDKDRLQEWMRENGYTLKTLAPVVGISYNTLWRMVVERPDVGDRFITAFIRQFGCDEAVRVFSDALMPEQ